MTKIQIVETEELLQYADFDSCEVRLLHRMSNNELDARVINEPELTESPLPSSMKLPQLLSMIWERHPNEDVKDGDGNVIDSAMSFSYEILTRSKDNFLVQSYVCAEECIKIMQEAAFKTN